ncbi:Lactose operon transcription activator, partial [Clarias magur]
ALLRLEKQLEQSLSIQGQAAPSWIQWRIWKLMICLLAPYLLLRRGMDLEQSPSFQNPVTSNTQSKMRKCQPAAAQILIK